MVAAAIADPRLIRRVAIAVVAIVIFLQVFDWLFDGIKHLLFLVLLAWLFSIAMEPAVSWLARRGWRRGLATGAVMLGLFVAIVAFFAIFGTIFVEQIVSLVQDLPDQLTRLVDWFNSTFNTDFNPEEIISELQITQDQVGEWAQTLGLGIFGFLTSLLGIVFDLFTILLFAFYLSADGPRLRKTVASWLPQQSQRVTHQVWEIAVEKTGGYVLSRLVLAFISAFFTSIFLFIMDVPFWLPLGIWTGVVSQFIPTIGTYLGGALPVIFAFSDSAWDGVAVIIFITLYQQVENYLFAPRISRRTMDIHPAVAFGAVIVGASLGGAMGALIAIPIVASIQAIVETYGRRYELIPEIELHDADETVIASDLPPNPPAESTPDPA